MKNHNPALDKEKKLAGNLENLLSNIEDREVKKENLKKGIDIKPEGATMNFMTVQGEAAREAEEVLNSVIEFYCDKELIDDEIIKTKKKGDILSLSNILFQLKTAQYAIIKLLEEIDLGNTHPRIFESLAQLQNQMMNIVKHQAAYTIQLQESYKQLKVDSTTISAKQLGEKSSETKILKAGDNGVGIKTRGTKDLINNLDFDEVEIGEDEDTKVDARERPETPGFAKDKNTRKEEDPYKIDEEQF